MSLDQLGFSSFIQCANGLLQHHGLAAWIDEAVRRFGAHGLHGLWLSPCLKTSPKFEARSTWIQMLYTCTTGAATHAHTDDRICLRGVAVVGVIIKITCLWHKRSRKPGLCFWRGNSGEAPLLAMVLSLLPSPWTCLPSVVRDFILHSLLTILRASLFAMACLATLGQLVQSCPWSTLGRWHFRHVATTRLKWLAAFRFASWLKLTLLFHL